MTQAIELTALAAIIGGAGLLLKSMLATFNSILQHSLKSFSESQKDIMLLINANTLTLAHLMRISEGAPGKINLLISEIEAIHKTLQRSERS